MYEKIIYIVGILILLTSCNTTRILSDNTERTQEHRELESQIQDGETELAITGTELKSTANNIGQSVEGIKSTGTDLEQSIEQSKNDKSEIGEILQRVRSRKVPADFINEFDNR